MPEKSDNFENRLSTELQGLFAGPPMGTERDRAILAAARHAGQAPSQNYHFRRRIAWALATAAAIAVATGMTWQFWPRSGGGYQRTGDIRDAFYAARQIKNHKTLDGSWDANNDGLVDEKDVRSLALAAVKVSQPKGVTP